MVNWNQWLAYQMPKTVTVQVWQVGLVHRLCQACVIFYLVYSLYRNNTWALQEVPGGSSNSWPEEGGWRLAGRTRVCCGDGRRARICGCGAGHGVGHAVGWGRRRVGHGVERGMMRRGACLSLFPLLYPSLESLFH